MMDLDEAIQHCKEQVQEQAKKGCYSCAEEHQQLAEWLKELKAYRNKSEILNTCEDAVSRQEAHEAVYSANGLAGAMKNIDALPSVTPQPRTGRWIQKEEEGEAEPFIIWECSECNEAQKRRTKYCPKCGANMEVKE